MKRMLIIALFVAFAAPLAAQQTIFLQPGPEKGKDAMVWDDPLYDKAVRNFGERPELLAHAWTDQGVPVYARSYVEFDLTSCPDMQTLIVARLYLYNNPEGTFEGSHQSIGSCSSAPGPNNGLVRRVTAPWDEATINWNNKPSGTSLHQAFIPAPMISRDDFVIDVTQMVRDMYATDPPQNYGFLIRLQEESIYRALVLTSSDYWDWYRRPMLELVFATTTGIDDLPVAESARLSVYPNPVQDVATGTLPSEWHADGTVGVFNALGEQVRELQVPAQGSATLDAAGMPAGMYFLRLLGAADAPAVTPMLVR